MKSFNILLVLAFFGCANSSTWKFTVPPSTLVVTEQDVVQKKKPILYVIHDNDGQWRFLAEATMRLDPAVEISLRDLIAVDSSLVDVAYLKKGWTAWRATKGSAWNSEMYK